MAIIGRVVAAEQLEKEAKQRKEQLQAALNKAAENELTQTIPQNLSLDNHVIGLKEKLLHKNSRYLQDILTTNQE